MKNKTLLEDIILEYTGTRQITQVASICYAKPTSAQGTQGADFGALAAAKAAKWRRSINEHNRGADASINSIYHQDLGLTLLSLTTSGSSAGFSSSDILNTEMENRNRCFPKGKKYR